ncbi:MAG TPA: DUF6498-containing protein [Burkholderiales bacterium]|nr:DUF6498-containing protein [Burkholderiales bacterium]
MDPLHAKKVMEQAALAPEAATTDAEPASRHQAAALLWANLPVVAGVAFLGWRMHEVMYLYWLDCMVLGLFTFLRVLRCEPARPQATAPNAVMFLLVYTGVLLFFESFIRHFFTPPGVDKFQADLETVMAALFSQPGVFLGFLVMLGSHGAAFVAYLLAGKFRVRVPLDVTGEAGSRIMVLIAYLTAGGFANQVLGSPLLAVVLFVAAKVFYDLKRYREEGGGETRSA